MEEMAFVIISLALLGTLLGMTYKTKLIRFGLLFIFTLALFLAFYLFQYGSLATFEIKALSGEVKFIKEKKIEAQQAIEVINEMKGRIQKLLADSQRSQKKIEDAKTRILNLEKELSETTNLTRSPILSLHSSKIDKVSSGYRTLLRFKPSKNQPLEAVVFTARVQKGSNSKILDLWPSAKHHAFASGPASKKITDEGKTARLQFSLVGASYPTVLLTVSEPAQLLIDSNYLPEPFFLNIE